MGYDCGSWARLTNELPLDKRPQAIALANIIAMAPAGTPFSVPQLSTNLGDAWEQGAEAIVEYLANPNVGLAQITGEGDAEAVTFNVLPDPTHV